MLNILQQLGVKGTGVTSGISPLSANADNTATLGGIRAATRLISHFFSPLLALASIPTFTLVPSSFGRGKIVVSLFYYIPSRQEALSNSSIQALGEALSRLFGRPVELRLTRVHYSYMNSHILAQYVAINSARYNLTRIQRALWSAIQIVNQRKLAENGMAGATLPAYIVGVKVRISGRLAQQRTVARQTVEEVQVGSFNSGSHPLIIDAGSYTSTNMKGSFTVKVWLSQLPVSS